MNEGIWLQGKVAIPPGTTLHGSVVEAVASGRVKGQAKLALALKSVELDGKSYSVLTDTLTYSGEGHTGQHVGSWFGGALQGALYGVLFGGKDGAIIGSAAGAGAGAASSIWNGKLDIEFPQGSKLMFETQAPFMVPDHPAAPLPPSPPPTPSPAPAPAPAKEQPKTETKPAT